MPTKEPQARQPGAMTPVGSLLTDLTFDLRLHFKKNGRLGAAKKNTGFDPIQNNMLIDAYGFATKAPEFKPLMQAIAASNDIYKHNHALQTSIKEKLQPHVTLNSKAEFVFKSSVSEKKLIELVKEAVRETAPAIVEKLTAENPNLINDLKPLSQQIQSEKGNKHSVPSLTIKDIAKPEAELKEKFSFSKVIDLALSALKSVAHFFKKTDLPKDDKEIKPGGFAARELQKRDGQAKDSSKSSAR